MTAQPIGVFDSGVGGLSVLHRCVIRLPHENFIYYADRANMPYGELPQWRIREVATNCAARLVALGCKAIVVACNTATEAAIDYIRRAYGTMPVIGLEPALKPCCAELGSGYALALVTVATERSARFKRLLSAYGDAVTVSPRHDLARLIEANIDDLERIRPEVYDILSPYADAEAVVLGCSHYSFVAGMIRDYYGGDIKLYDGADGAAAQLAVRLAEHGLLAPGEERGSIRFFSN